MRSTTILLGIILSLISVVLLSGRGSLNESDYGFNAGEIIPSMMGVDNDYTTQILNEEYAIMVVWSSDDATSRLVNAWISHAKVRDKALVDVPIYSICIDKKIEDANYYSRMDNVNLNGIILCSLANNRQANRGIIRELVSGNGLKVFYTHYGKIVKSRRVNEIWQEIQSQ